MTVDETEALAAIEGLAPAGVTHDTSAFLGAKSGVELPIAVPSTATRCQN